jgi:uncharacterized protein
MTIRKFLQFPLRFWHRWLSPMLPPMCRFYPSCSMYAVEALERHSLPRAFWLIAVRVVKCQPLHPGGFDPVPDPETHCDSPACSGHAPRVAAHSHRDPATRF